MTDWVITDAKTFSDMDGSATQYADGDDLTINSGGTVTVDLAWAGSDGSRDSHDITINAGGTLIIDPGVRLDVAATYDIFINEGGTLAGNGTSASPIILKGNDKTDSSHRIYLQEGGRFYMNYATISDFYAIRTHTGGAGLVQIINSTIENMYLPFYSTTNFGPITLINCVVLQSTANQHIFTSLSDATITAINCTFTVATATYFVGIGTVARLIFAGCTLDGSAIPSNRGTTSAEWSVQIYEASTVTVTGIENASISVDHASLQTDGMFLDTTNYMRVPAYLSYAETASDGTVKIYTLQKTAYWPSGLAVGSRTFKHWSTSTEAETGDNQKYTFTAGKVGHTTAAETAWSGANPSAIAIAALSPRVTAMTAQISMED